MSKKKVVDINEVKKGRPVVETKLSLNEKQEAVASDIRKQFMEDEIKELPSIKEGDVNISTAYVYDEGDKLEVGVYIRNGLTRPINFEKVPLVLVNSKSEIVVEDIFELEELGIIPPHSVRPWTIKFDKKKLKIKNFDCRDLTIQFKKNMKAVEYVKVEAEDLPKNLTPLGKRAIKEYINNLPKLEKGQFSLSSFFVREEKDGELGVAVIFRNASGKEITIDKLPIKIYDANNNFAAGGVFNNLNIKVKDGKVIIKEFMFKKEQRQEGKFDFNKYLVKFE